MLKLFSEFNCSAFADKMNLNLSRIIHFIFNSLCNFFRDDNHLFIVNLFILIFTLGLGYAFVVTRTMNYLVQHIELEGEIDLSELQQTEDAYTDATGEDLSDMLDIDFVF